MDIHTTRGTMPENSPLIPFSLNTIDKANKVLCFFAKSLPELASIILVFATSKGVVTAALMLPVNKFRNLQSKNEEFRHEVKFFTNN